MIAALIYYTFYKVLMDRNFLEDPTFSLSQANTDDDLSMHYFWYYICSTRQLLCVLDVRVPLGTNNNGTFMCEWSSVPLWGKIRRDSGGRGRIQFVFIHRQQSSSLQTAVHKVHPHHGCLILLDALQPPGAQVGHITGHDKGALWEL